MCVCLPRASFEYKFKVSMTLDSANVFIFNTAQLITLRRHALAAAFFPVSFVHTAVCVFCLFCFIISIRLNVILNRNTEYRLCGVFVVCVFCRLFLLALSGFYSFFKNVNERRARFFWCTNDFLFHDS